MSFTLRGGLIPPSSSPAAPTTTPSLIPTSFSPFSAQYGVVIVYCAGGSVGLMHVAGAGTPVVHVAPGAIEQSFRALPALMYIGGVNDGLATMCSTRYSANVRES